MTKVNNSKTTTDEKMEAVEPLWKLFKETSDRETAIVGACYLDDLLQQIIKKSFITDPKIDSIFKSGNILQSFYAKINIAYFSGLINSDIYHDLKIICEIRNDFAHAVMTKLDFNDEKIAKKINDLKLPPNGVPFFGEHPYIKFRSVVSIIVYWLILCDGILSKKPTQHLVDILIGDPEVEKYQTQIDAFVNTIKDLGKKKKK